MKDTVTMLVEALEACVKELESHKDNPYCHLSDKDTNKALESGKAALSAAKGGEWIGMKSAPMDGTKVLAYFPATKDISVICFEDGCWRNGWDGYEYSSPITQPTAWQPLPPPPKD